MLGLNYYGGTTIYVHGLPPTLVIGLSELFAVVCEALLIAILSRISLKTWWIWGISLLMIAASFLIGQFLITR